MKLKIKKAEWETLNEEVQKLYKKSDEDHYKLDVEDDDVAPELRRANERLKQEKKDLADKLAEIEAKLEEIEEKGTKKGKDVDALETSYKDKLKKQKEEFEAKLKKKDDQLSRLLVDNVAQSMASEISTKPNLILPHIKAALAADLDGEEPVTRVLGKDGKPSATTLAELKQTFVDNEDFAPIIIGSKASGSGGGGSTKGSGGAKKPEEYTEKERTDLFRTNKEEFYRLFPPR